jgi:hypothetical protein
MKLRDINHLGRRFKADAGLARSPRREALFTGAYAGTAEAGWGRVVIVQISCGVARTGRDAGLTSGPTASRPGICSVPAAL